MNIYMAITNDKYELPLDFANTLLQLSKRLNIPFNTCKDILYQNRSNRAKTIRIIKIALED